MSGQKIAKVAAAFDKVSAEEFTEYVGAYKPTLQVEMWMSFKILRDFYRASADANQAIFFFSDASEFELDSDEDAENTE